MRAWWSDARHFQIVALASLLAVDFIWIDFGAKALYSALAISSALLTQIVCSRYFGLPRIDLRSPLITGLSLSLLLRANAPWLPAIAAFTAIASKFVLRIDGRHVFNPAGFAIVVLLLASSGVWISPGQWGASVWFASLLAFLAIMVLQASQRSDVVLFFLVSHAGLLFVRAYWLGDPLAIPLHQIQSGSLLIFAFFMISDPRTTPDSRLGRLFFALAVALFAHYLAFFMQIRPALYMALIALSPVTRLHVRYDAKSFPEDLNFIETGDRGNFQARYILHHPYVGGSCPAAESYRASLPARFKNEAKNLADLTGWPQKDIQVRMAASGQPISGAK